MPTGPPSGSSRSTKSSSTEPCREVAAYEVRHAQDFVPIVLDHLRPCGRVDHRVRPAAIIRPLEHATHPEREPFDDRSAAEGLAAERFADAEPRHAGLVVASGHV